VLDSRPLRFTTWLSPGLPEGLFDVIARRVSAGLGRGYTLTIEPEVSGPIHPEDDRFALGLTDVGFLCPPSFLWLSERSPASVSLVPLAATYDDPRAGRRPVYFSDVIVGSVAAIGSFDDLRGRRVGFNDRASLSGYLSLLARLADDGLDVSFFGELYPVGSHRRALALIAAGELDAAAVDANVWRAYQRELPEHAGRLRSVAALGPFPVQPIVVRATAAASCSGRWSTSSGSRS
jgi:phosphonate transport system substrate-binding protein